MGNAERVGLLKSRMCLTKNIDRFRLRDIALRGNVRIKSHHATGEDEGWTIEVFYKDTLLIGTCVLDLHGAIGDVGAIQMQRKVDNGSYIVDLTPMEVMGIRGRIRERIKHQEWSE